MSITGSRHSRSYSPGDYGRNERTLYRVNNIKTSTSMISFHEQDANMSNPVSVFPNINRHTNTKFIAIRDTNLQPSVQIYDL